MNKTEMYDQYHTWALQNYGESGKTKTVTRKKYDRIVRFLKGQEPPTTENAKFRFRIKGKGFRLQPGSSDQEQDVLLVPAKNMDAMGTGELAYKRVAVVEDFFDIIYNVHVEMDGRGGKHAGQKRTYKAISEKYSFLPREAVTRFLMNCTECQKRMHLSPTIQRDIDAVVDEVVPEIDYSIPLTTTYQMQQNRLAATYEDNVSLSSGDSEISDPSLTTNMSAESTSASPQQLEKRLKTSSEDFDNKLGANSPSGNSPDVQPLDMSTARGGPEKGGKGSSLLLQAPAGLGAALQSHLQGLENYSLQTIQNYQTPITELYGGSARPKITHSDAPEDLSISQEDDDDDNDDDSEKMSESQEVDPERLKAFNMFVRLFVDENLDRTVPISKQPKDKVQAIIDACCRQFPEFSERARKRIRTYLKSCRRMKRARDANGLDVRPTPPHLTSAAAETLLATACQNESENAKKRMKLESYHHTQNSLGGDHYSNDLLQDQRSTAEYKFSNGAFYNGYQSNLLHGQQQLLQSTQATITNGPTDLSIKKSALSTKPQLSSTEVTTIKQLISGYRESAAFLYRSADELEQLLLQST